MTASRSVACSACGHHFMSAKEKARCRCGSRQVAEVDRSALDAYKEQRHEERVAAPPEDFLPTIEDPTAEGEPVFGAPGVSGDEPAPEPAVAAAPMAPAVADVQPRVERQIVRAVTPAAVSAPVNEQSLGRAMEQAVTRALSRLPPPSAQMRAAPAGQEIGMGDLVAQMRDSLQLMMMSSMVEKFGGGNGHGQQPPAPDVEKIVKAAVSEAVTPYRQMLEKRETQDLVNSSMEKVAQLFAPRLRDLEEQVRRANQGVDPNTRFLSERLDKFGGTALREWKEATELAVSYMTANGGPPRGKFKPATEQEQRETRAYIEAEEAKQAAEQRAPQTDEEFYRAQLRRADPGDGVLLP